MNNNEKKKGKGFGEKPTKDLDPWGRFKEDANRDDHLKTLGHLSEFVEQKEVKIKLSVQDKDGVAIDTGLSSFHCCVSRLDCK